MRSELQILVALASVVVAAVAVTAHAGPVSDLYRGGAFGLPWNASSGAIEAKYPGGQWDTDTEGHKRYCAPTRQPLLQLPHQTRELCFLIGSDGTMASVTAKMDASLASLLAVVNRSRTRFGDFDAVKREEGKIQSAYTYMLWTRDVPYVVQVASANDPNGAPMDVTFTIADEAALHTKGMTAVTNKPNAQGK